MMSYKELAQLGYCPSTKYSAGKPLPVGYQLKESVPDSIWKRMPLQLNVMYSTENVGGFHSLISFKRNK